MAAGNIDDLAARLVRSGTTDRDKLIDALTGMGYPKHEARAAAHKATPEQDVPEPVSEPSPAPQPTAPSGGPSDSGLHLPAFSPGGDAAGFVLGILGMAVIVNYLHGGPDQVRAWLRAKFLNNVSAAGANTSPAGVGVSNPTNPTTGVNPYDVHAAMTRAGYNTAHATAPAGRSLRGGQVAGP